MITNIYIALYYIPGRHYSKREGGREGEGEGKGRGEKERE